MSFWNIPPQLKGEFDSKFPGFWDSYQKVKAWLDGQFWPDGSVRLPHLSDADAKNDSVYYSTTANKAAYKDSAGVVHSLY